MQYTQQAVSRWLVSKLESYGLTAGHINFTDQSINRHMALTSSVTKEYSTIDLSDASDRVLNKLVAPLFSSNEDLRDAIQACRSLRANVNGEIIPLAKFASMGSALCFPIEAMVFYAICVLGHIRATQKTISYESVKNASKEVYVYGDDIIVPAYATPVVMQTLSSFCLRVNVQKSFVNGHFRESCGCDAYNGIDVTPVYVRRHLKRDKTDVPSIVSNIETANQFARKGYWRSFDRIKTICEREYKFPYVGERSEALGWRLPSYREPTNIAQDYCFIDSSVRSRWNSDYQRVEIHTLVQSVKYKSDRLECRPRLTKWFLSKAISDNSVGDARGGPPGYQIWKHKRTLSGTITTCVAELNSKQRVMSGNEQSVRIGAATLKHRWLQPW